MPKNQPGPDRNDDRQVISGILHVLTSGFRWRDCPAICRWRHQQRFAQRLAGGEKLPVLVSEGDSWFQFPFLIDDVIDQLEPDILVWSLDAAGDTADNMVNRPSSYAHAADA